jgi:hypothetical protein
MERRDPSASKTRVALTDGERALQIRVDGKLNVTLILDLMHVLEKLWRAAYVFHAEGSLEAELWVLDRTLRILLGDVGQVVARSDRIDNVFRTRVDKCSELESIILRPGTCMQHSFVSGGCSHGGEICCHYRPTSESLSSLRNRYRRTSESAVVKGIRQSITKRSLSGAKGETLETVADYLYRNRTRMHYDEYLANGWHMPVVPSKVLART